LPDASSRTPRDADPAGIVANTDRVPSGAIRRISRSGFSDRYRSPRRPMAMLSGSWGGERLTTGLTREPAWAAAGGTKTAATTAAISADKKARASGLITERRLRR